MAQANNGTSQQWRKADTGYVDDYSKDPVRTRTTSRTNQSCLIKSIYEAYDNLVYELYEASPLVCADVGVSVACYESATDLAFEATLTSVEESNKLCISE